MNVVKNGNPCPKCQGKRIARVPFISIHQSDYVSIGVFGMNNVNFERWICMACGYKEDWAEEPALLEGLAQYEV